MGWPLGARRKLTAERVLGHLRGKSSCCLLGWFWGFQKKSWKLESVTTESPWLGNADRKSKQEKPGASSPSFLLDFLQHRHSMQSSGPWSGLVNSSLSWHMSQRRHQNPLTDGASCLLKSPYSYAWHRISVKFIHDIILFSKCLLFNVYDSLG